MPGVVCRHQSAFPGVPRGLLGNEAGLDGREDFGLSQNPADKLSGAVILVTLLHVGHCHGVGISGMSSRAVGWSHLF